ncbi:hypothetical protein M758_9G162300 [Ceratodon purpureus]|nr:hypothetical protein M758_9G162300 [Ceratodon purpureus]
MILCSLHIFERVAQDYCIHLAALLHTAKCHKTRFSKGAAKAQLSRIIGGLGGGGLIGRNFVSPGLRFQGLSFHLLSGC